MKILVIAILSLTYSVVSIAQQKSCVVRGRVADVQGEENLTLATITLRLLKDSVVIRQVVTNKNGFVIKTIPGEYQLLISYKGYRDTLIAVSIKEKDTLVDIGKIYLHNSSDELMGVVVKSVIPPVIVRNDTLVFNANAFKTKPNASVEDLLKKLPGINIDGDGNVTLHGKKVEKIYIEGKEFFLNDPIMATRNLSADIVESIEAFDNQTDRAKFTGIKDVDVNKAINLRLKKDKKKGLFGNATAKAGTSNTYSGNVEVTSFKGDRWVQGNAYLNLADNLTTGAGMRQSQMSQALNYRDNSSKKTEIVINALNGVFRNQSSEIYNRETFLGDSSLLQSRNSFNDFQSKFTTVNAQLTVNIDSFNTIKYNPTISPTRGKINSMDTSLIFSRNHENDRLVNEGKTMNTSNFEGLNVGNSITYRRIFRKRGRFLSGEFSQNTLQQKTHGQLYSLLKFHDTSELSPDKLIDQFYNQKTNNNTCVLKLSYTEPVTANHIIDFGYDLNSVTGSFDKRSFNYNSLTGKYDKADSLLSNKLSNTNDQQNFSIGYNFLGSKSQYQLGVSMLRSHQENENSNMSYGRVVQRTLNWSPRASAMYRLSRQKNLKLRYNGNSVAPETYMLQPVPDLTNPYLISEGNPNLKQQFNHTVNAAYNASNSSTFTHVSISAGGYYIMNSIVQSSEISSAGIQHLMYINVNGNYGFNGNFNYGIAFNKGSTGGGDLTSTVQYNRGTSFVNKQQNERRGLILGQGCKINYHSGEKFFINVSANVNYTRSHYAINNRYTELTSQDYAGDITMEVPFGIRLNSEVKMQIIGKQANLSGRTIVMWNAAAFKNFFGNKAEVRIEAVDLLNRNTGFNQQMGDNYIETNERYVMKRYISIGFRYNFRANKM